MRETCARVLAAALMTGAVGFAVAMPALFGTTPEASQSLKAPPSSLRRSVPVVSPEASSRPPAPGRLLGAHRVASTARQELARLSSSRSVDPGRLRVSGAGRPSGPAP